MNYKIIRILISDTNVCSVILNPKEIIPHYYNSSIYFKEYVQEESISNGCQKYTLSLYRNCIRSSLKSIYNSHSPILFPASQRTHEPFGVALRNLSSTICRIYKREFTQGFKGKPVAAILNPHIFHKYLLAWLKQNIIYNNSLKLKFFN